MPDLSCGETLSFRAIEAGGQAILIVDDDPLLRLTLADFLGECGFRVLEATSAEEAIAMLNAYGRDGGIDLVFSDVVMPGADGFALAHWVRRNRPGLPVMLASGDTGKAAKAREVCAGGNFFAKPYDLRKVLAGIRAALKA